jgi:hypothetical protein
MSDSLNRYMVDPQGTSFVPFVNCNASPKFTKRTHPLRGSSKLRVQEFNMGKMRNEPITEIRGKSERREIAGSAWEFRSLQQLHQTNPCARRASSKFRVPGSTFSKLRNEPSLQFPTPQNIYMYVSQGSERRSDAKITKRTHSYLCVLRVFCGSTASFPERTQREAGNPEPN